MKEKLDVQNCTITSSGFTPSSDFVNTNLMLSYAMM